MTVDVVAAAIVQHGRVLAVRRTRPAELAGRWELPGGKVDPGETAVEALGREISEELGCLVEVGAPLGVRSALSTGVALTAYVASLVQREPLPGEHDALRWLGPEELDEVDWLSADRPFLGELRTLLLDGERLVGNVGGTARIGSTVRRPVGPWSPAVHSLLGYLGDQGFSGVPAVLGSDEQGREALSYLPGRVLDVELEVASSELLADAMRWLRRFHDTVEGFTHPGPWRNDQAIQSGHPAGTGSGRRSDQLVCHNDFAPYNVATRGSGDGESVVGVFDWDMAGPGTRLDDLAFAAWNWVPLHQALSSREVAERLETMASGYAAQLSAVDIVDAVVPRIERALERIRSGQEAGDPGMLNLALVGEPGRTQWALDQLHRQIPDVRSRLVSEPGRTLSP